MKRSNALSQPGVLDSFPSGKRDTRLVALVEVGIAFALTHFAFRALKHFTIFGRIELLQNLTPGLVMTVYTFAMLAVCRRSFAAYGLNFTAWREDLKVGLFWGGVLAVGGAVLALMRIRHQPGARPPGMTESLVFAASCVIGIAFFVCFLKRQKTLVGRVPVTFGMVVLIAVLTLPIAIAARQQQSVGHAISMVIWLFFGAGFGEEIFYRGYLQSRLNLAFRKPFRLGAIEFGAGLLVTSLLFGFLHALNTVDYFEGRFTFAWGYGAATFCVGMLYGLLRETTGGILAGAVTHGVLDILARLVSYIP